MIGAGAGAWATVGFFWRAGLMAGLQVGQALGCSGHVPGHPTSIRDKAVIGIKTTAVSAVTDRNSTYYDTSPTEKTLPKEKGV